MTDLEPDVRAASSATVQLRHADEGVEPCPPAPAPALPKPALRGWLHLVWFELSLVAGTLLISHVPDRTRAAATVYVLAVCSLFGTSALYHRGTWRPAVHRLLQRLDHAMIFFLIAGTATPVFAFAVHGALSAVLLSGMWGLATVAMSVHMVRMQAPELLVGCTYVALGCVGVVALPAVWVDAGITSCMLVASGGVCYIVGALLYHRRRPDPWPTIFGFHEVFHVFVCAGATLHYVAIVQLLA